MRAARGAYDEPRKCRARPKRADAGLIVGTIGILSAMALPMRWVAYMAGFGGGKEGDAADSLGVEYRANQTDARLALLLIYNREGR